MTKEKRSEPVVGFNIPAAVGMALEDVATPALIIELDAFESNVAYLRQFVKNHHIRLRAHAKTHKSADIALYQMAYGGACGICCQKLSEAEALAAGGVGDILISNQVVDPRKIVRLAELAGKVRIIVCVDDTENIENLSAAAKKAGTVIECLVEIDCGAGRCGVPAGKPAVALAKKIATSEGLVFSGLQAYQGSAQHIRDFSKRRASIDKAISQTRKTVELLNDQGLACDIVGGAGTGTYCFEGNSGVYNEMQCGSYIFMDADYKRVKDETGQPLSEFQNSLFILTTIMSKTKDEIAICDAGLKAQSIDSGLPKILNRPDLEYIGCSDEHGVIDDPSNVLKLNDRLKLIPGHCDPTCNLYDWFVGVRDGKVECLWPVTARGMMY
jgi:3-hydroxy-D-aspartate aldolase